MKTLTNSLNYGATLAEASVHLANMEPFHTGTMSASVSDEHKDAPAVYVVYSYGTVIAWALDNSDDVTVQYFIAPGAYTHSATTSKHANIVKKAWGI